MDNKEDLGGGWTSHSDAKQRNTYCMIPQKKKDAGVLGPGRGGEVGASVGWAMGLRFARKPLLEWRNI